MPYIALPRRKPPRSTNTSRPLDQNPSESPATDKPIFSPKEIARILSRFNRAKFARYEKFNPFPGIDLNFGNNRERLLRRRVLEWYPHKEESKEEIRNIIEAFNGFSFKRQARPKKLELGELEGSFGRIFQGTDTEGWTIQPEAWWAARKHVCAMDDRGRTFLDQMEQQVEDIEEAVDDWWEHADMSLNMRKRKLFSAGVRSFSLDREPLAKRQKPNKTKPAQVMSGAWRAKRREQEKKAGRWTDGTVRQDRSIWAAFYWVLDD